MVGAIRSKLVKLDDVAAWPVAELHAQGIPAEVDEEGCRFCTMPTEIGPLKEGSGGPKSKRDVIMQVWDVAG